MSRNINLTDKRIKGKHLALMKVMLEGVSNVMKALNIECESFTPIPALSVMAKFNADQRLQAVAQIPSKYFKPDGTIDKRRQRLDIIIKGNN